jgi:DNA gyrase subunit B
MDRWNDIAAVRKRPGMYVGPFDDDDGTGLHHMIEKLVRRACLHCYLIGSSSVLLSLNADDSVTVQDDGLAIDVGVAEGMGRQIPEAILTCLAAGYGYQPDGDEYAFGNELVIANALSEYLELRIRRNDGEYLVRCRRGIIIEPLTRIAESQGRAGTQVTFLPDSDIFEGKRVQARVLLAGLGSLSIRYPGVTIDFKDHRLPAV